MNTDYTPPPDDVEAAAKAHAEEKSRVPGPHSIEYRRGIWRAVLSLLHARGWRDPAEVALLHGAAKADEERLIAAAEKAGVPYGGSDTPAALAEEVVKLRSDLRWMVENAASGGKLDAYRALGERAATAENARDDAIRDRDSAIARAEAAEAQAQTRTQQIDAAIIRERDAIDGLRDLIRHMRIHNGYPDCGRDQMTAVQRDRYNSVLAWMSRQREIEDAAPASEVSTELREWIVHCPRDDRGRLCVPIADVERVAQALAADTGEKETRDAH